MVKLEVDKKRNVTQILTPKMIHKNIFWSMEAMHNNNGSVCRTCLFKYKNTANIHAWAEEGVMQ